MDLSEQLTKNFTLWEVSDHHYSPRRPPEGKALANMRLLVARVVQPMRERWGRQLWVVSGYRTAETNADIGGAYFSQHMRGKAIDLSPFPHATMAALRRGDVIADSSRKLLLEFFKFADWWVHHDQCDYVGGYGEYPSSGWVHIDIRPRGPGGHICRWTGSGVGSEQ